MANLCNRLWDLRKREADQDLALLSLGSAVSIALKPSSRHLCHPQEGQALPCCHFLRSSGWGLCRSLLLTHGGLCRVVWWNLSSCLLFKKSTEQVQGSLLRLWSQALGSQHVQIPVAHEALTQLLCTQRRYNSETSGLGPVLGFSTCTIIIIKHCHCTAIMQR